MFWKIDVEYSVVKLWDWKKRYFNRKISKQNLKLPPAKGDDAEGGGYPEAGKGDAGHCLRVIVGFHSSGDHDEVEEPLDGILVTRFAQTLVDRQIVTGDMVWGKESQLFIAEQK